MRTVIESTLPLLLFAGLATAQTVPAQWDRHAEWIAPEAAAIGTTLGNPAPDSVGNLVWNYEWQNSLVGSGIPMWAQWSVPTPMVVDPDFWGGSPAWTPAPDFGANVQGATLLDDYHHDFGLPWKPKPFVRWENTTGQSFTLDIVGTLTVIWDGQAGAVYPTPVDVGIVFLDASAGYAKTPLYVAHVDKPTPASLLTESLILPPVDVPDVSIDPGDSLLISVSGVDATGSVNYVFLVDDVQFIVDDYCQPDIGFGGPGTTALGLCGDPLATGGSATLQLTGAPAFATTFVGYSTAFNPTAMLGGTIVPVPPIGLLMNTTDAAGEMSLAIPGGGGPLTIYAQAVVLDPGSTTVPVHVSNAIEATLLP